MGSATGGLTAKFITAGRRARHLALVRRRARSTGRAHVKQLDPTIGTFTWVVRNLHIGTTTTTGMGTTIGAKITTRSGALSRRLRRGLLRRLRGRKRVHFRRRVRRTLRLTSNRHVRSIRAHRRVRHLRLMRSTPARSVLIRRIARTNKTLAVRG